MSDYKTIDGIRYERKLLEEAEAMVAGKGDGRISFEDAKALIDSAMDGGRITRIERRTLHHIFTTLNVTGKAQDYAHEQLFKLVDTHHYDLSLIDAAELAVEGRGDGRISLDDAQLIAKMVDFDGKVTTIERNTIGYILETYKCTDPAKELLRGLL